MKDIIRKLVVVASLGLFMVFTIATLPDPSGQCDNTCSSSNNGTCDDGGAGSESSSCALGSDCDDCGERGDGDSPGGEGEKFTCSDSTYGICVEFTVPDPAAANDLRTQCAEGATDGHNCSHAGAGFCGFANSNDTPYETCNYTYNPPPDHDSICESELGVVGCGNVQHSQ